MFGVLGLDRGELLGTHRSFALRRSRRNAVEIVSVLMVLALSTGGDDRAAWGQILPVVPALEVLPDQASTYTFFGYEGGPFEPETASTWVLDNSTTTELDFQIFSDQAWLRVEPNSGSLPGTLFRTATVDAVAVIDQVQASALAPGLYSVTVTFVNLTSGDGNTTRTVTLQVAPANFSISPAFVAAVTSVNAPNPVPVAVTLTSNGLVDLNYRVTLQSRSWFSVPSSGGTVPGGGSDTFLVSFNSAGLPSGAYSSTITVENLTNGAGTRDLPVELIVYPSSSAAISVLPDADIEVRGPVGGIPEVIQASTLVNGSDRHVSWTAVSDQPWVSITPSAGALSATDGANLGPDEQNVELRLNIARNELAAGSHIAVVTFSDLTINPFTGVITSIAFGTRIVRVLADPVLRLDTPLEGGHVTILPPGDTVVGGSTGAVLFRFGEVVTLTAVADDGFEFTGWVTDFEIEEELENPLVVTMDASHNIGAVFAPIQRTLTLSTSGSGTGTAVASPAGVFIDNSVVSRYNHGTVIELSAVADAGSVFLGWAGNVPAGSELTNPLTVPMDRDRTITARLEEGVTLSLTITGDGEVSVDPDLDVYELGTTVTLTATPIGSASFIAWSGDRTSTAETLAITLTDSVSIVAAFGVAEPGSEPEPGQNVNGDPTTATLVVNVDGDGVVTPSGGTFAIGAKVTLIATPGIGESFVRWDGDADGDGLTTLVTMDGDRTVLAVFTGADQPAGQPNPNAPLGPNQLCGAMGSLGLVGLFAGCVMLSCTRIGRRGASLSEGA
ncbi:MAG: hypothetical protein IID35_06610 [Planctomycetes bacterium]|nr:hypothetical protein [Planctomycetota bacterium]